MSSKLDQLIAVRDAMRSDFLDARDQLKGNTSHAIDVTVDVIADGLIAPEDREIQTGGVLHEEQPWDDPDNPHVYDDAAIDDAAQEHKTRYWQHIQRVHRNDVDDFRASRSVEPSESIHPEDTLDLFEPEMTRARRGLSLAAAETALDELDAEIAQLLNEAHAATLSMSREFPGFPGQQDDDLEVEDVMAQRDLVPAEPRPVIEEKPRNDGLLTRLGGDPAPRQCYYHVEETTLDVRHEWDEELEALVLISMKSSFKGMNRAMWIAPNGGPLFSTWTDDRISERQSRDTFDRANWRDHSVFAKQLAREDREEQHAAATAEFLADAPTPAERGLSVTAYLKRWDPVLYGYVPPSDGFAHVPFVYEGPFTFAGDVSPDVVKWAYRKMASDRANSWRQPLGEHRAIWKSQAKAGTLHADPAFTARIVRHLAAKLPLIHRKAQDLAHRTAVNEDRDAQNGHFSEWFLQKRIEAACQPLALRLSPQGETIEIGSIPAETIERWQELERS